MVCSDASNNAFEGPDTLGANAIREVAGFGGRYSVTANGDVLDNKHGSRKVSGWQSRKTEGRRVSLYANDGMSRRLVADLVAEAFLDNPFGIAHALHKDGDVLNDSLGNLAWGVEPLVGEDGSEEEWVNDPSFDYIVTNLGRIIGKDHGKPAALIVHGNGAKSYNGFGVNRMLGDIVAEAFGLPNPHGLAHALFKNGNRGDCRLANLTYDPNELAESVKAGEVWRFLVTSTGDELFVSSLGRTIATENARFYKCYVNETRYMFNNRHCHRAADLVAEAFGLPNPLGVAHALFRDGNPSNFCLENLTFDPSEVRGHECEWRPVPGFEAYLVGADGKFFKIDAEGRPFSAGRAPSSRRARFTKVLYGPGGEAVATVPDLVAHAFADVVGENRFGAARPWHLDGDPHNCEASNLSWVPASPEGRNEQWAPFPGHENSHIVSSLGRVANLQSGLLVEEPLLACGKAWVPFGSGARRELRAIEEAVAARFSGRMSDNRVIVHLDCNPLNNEIGNIRVIKRGDLGNFAADAVRRGISPDVVASYFKGEGGAAERMFDEGGPALYGPLLEGRVRTADAGTISVRSKMAKDLCLAIKGTTCAICGDDVTKIYGPGVRPVVHHIRPLSESSGMREVDPVRDLIPVCPNCHAALHSKPGHRECYTPAELRVMIAAQKKATAA